MWTTTTRNTGQNEAVRIAGCESSGSLKNCADRLRAPVGPVVPAVGGPGLTDESADDDDRVGWGDDCVNHPEAFLGADGQFPESSVLPGIGALYDQRAVFWIGAGIPLSR